MLYDACIGLKAVLIGFNTDTFGSFGSSFTSLNLNGLGVLESNNCWLVNWVGVGENTNGLGVLVNVFLSFSIGFLCTLTGLTISVNTTGLGVKIIGNWSSFQKISLETSTIRIGCLFLNCSFCLVSSSLGIPLNLVCNLVFLSNL